MRDPRLSKLAEVLVRYSTAVRPGDLVAISAEAVAMPLIEEVTRAVLAAGGHPFWVPKSESLMEILLTQGTEEQVRYVSPIEVYHGEKIDVHIGFWAQMNTKYLGRVDPARPALLQTSRKPVMRRFLERAAKGELRWVGTQFPTLAAAQDAEMSLTQYEDFVFRAGLLHLPDPVAEWRRIEERQGRIRDYLQGKKQLHFVVPPHGGHDGTDLKVDVSGGTWINCAGKENFPDGEVFTGPQGADGHVNYTFPAVYQGREVQGVRLRFKAGRVVDASATKNEEFLFRMLDQDEGARNLGEIAIGTNYSIAEFSRNTLFDEKIGGTFHAAVGAGYPESGNTNDSGLHWDMVCDLRPSAASGTPGGTIHADGQLFHKDGKFTEAAFPGEF